MSSPRIAAERPARGRRPRGRFLALLVVLSVTASVATPARAGLVTAGTSNAYGELAGATSTSPFGGGFVTSGPSPTASGTAPAPYSVGPNALASVSVGDTTPAVGITRLTSGTLTVSAASDVDGLPGPRMATASAAVDNLLSNLSSANIIFNTLLAADAVQSTATVSGDYGSLAASGSTTIANGSFSNTGGGSGSLAVSPSVNEVFYNAGGLEIILNEQIVTGDGISSRGLVVNAIHIRLDLFSIPLLVGSEVLSGDIIIGHSEAALTAQPLAAVPEPATVGLLASGLVGLGLRARVRRR